MRRAAVPTAGTRRERPDERVSAAGAGIPRAVPRRHEAATTLILAFRWRLRHRRRGIPRGLPKMAQRRSG